jgi:glycine cleavage system transcriptional repressor
MKQWYMVTVVGKDRPGIVAALADALYRGGANLGEASMVRLGGNFTVMLMVETAESASTVEQWLATISRDLGLRLHVDAIDAHLHMHAEPNVRVTVHGADRPGIVAQVTSALARAGFNILDLNSDVGGSETHPIYIMVLEGHAADGAEVLERALSPLLSSGIEVRVMPLETMVG